MRSQLADVPVVPVDVDVQDQYAGLTAWARRSGHANGQKHHAADRWVAATAMAFGLELASGDGVFSGIAGLRRFPSPESASTR